MKQLTFFLLLFSLFRTQHTQAQQPALQGQWKVYCGTEKNEIALSICNFCLIEENGKSTYVHTFDMLIDAKNVTVTKKTVVTTVPYAYTSASGFLEFKIGSTPYRYKVVTVKNEKNLMLKDESGNILLLEKP